MSDSENVRTIFCSSCGKATSANAKFCGSCGTQVNGGQQSPGSPDDPSRIETNLRKFRARLTASCPNCRYHGLMGWNDFHFPMAKAVWMPLALILCLVGIIPGLIVFLLVQRAKRYQAECPNCNHALLLKMNEAQPVKSSWGGAQFYNSNGEKVSDGTMLARAGKWLLVGVAGLVGIIVLLGAAGIGLQKLGLVSESTNNIDRDALAYAGREPDATFFRLPRVRAAFQKVLDSDGLAQFDEDQIRHLDFEKCQFEGSKILSVAWTGRINTGIDGSIAALDLSSGRIVLASQGDEPGILIQGDIKASTLDQLPQQVQKWVERMKLQAAKQTGISVEQIPVKFTVHATADDARQTPSFPKSDRYVTAVRDGVLESHNTTTVGKAFEATFTDCKWESNISDKGVHFVEFTGRLKPDMYKASFDNAYESCVTAPREEAKKRLHCDDPREGRPIWPACTQEQLASLPPRLTPAEAATQCPNEGAYSTVKFQFAFSADGSSFSVGYIDLKPWEHTRLYRVLSGGKYYKYEPGIGRVLASNEQIGVSPEDVLNYIYQ